MGANARWVCHTCKMVCSEGGRPLHHNLPSKLTLAHIDSLKDRLFTLGTELKIQDQDSIMSFLNSLRVWLARHQGHNFYVGSDYSTDGMDLEDYFDETVEGYVSKITRHEVNMQCLDAFLESALRDTEAVIRECCEGKKTIREGAIELNNRFQVGNL